MSYDLPDDWYEDHDGQSLVLSAEKVGAEIERLTKELGAAQAEVVRRQDELGALLHAAEAELERNPKLQKRPVAFRVKDPNGWLLIDDEEVAERYASSLNLDYEPLFARCSVSAGEGDK